MAEKSLNKLQLIGRIGATPEIRYTQDQKAVANFTLATSESWNDKEGLEHSETEWHRVVVFGALAESVVQKYLDKGSRIFLEGKLKTKEWNDKENQKRFTTEVIIDQFNGQILMLDGPNRNSESEDKLKKAS